MTLNLFPSQVDFIFIDQSKFRQHFSIFLLLAFILFLTYNTIVDYTAALPASILRFEDQYDIQPFTINDILPQISSKSKCEININIDNEKADKIYPVKLQGTYNKERQEYVYLLLQNEKANELAQESLSYYNFQFEYKFFNCNSNNDIDNNLPVSNNGIDSVSFNFELNKEIFSNQGFDNKINFAAPSKLLKNYKNYANYWELDFKPLIKKEIKGFFSPFNTKEGSILSLNSTSYKLENKGLGLSKMYYDKSQQNKINDSSTVDEVMNIIINYRIWKKGDIMVIVYPKLSDTLPYHIILFLILILFLKVLFLLYDNYGKYNYLINDIFKITKTENTHKAQQKTFASKIGRKSNISDSNNTSTSDPKNLLINTESKHNKINLYSTTLSSDTKDNVSIISEKLLDESQVTKDISLNNLNKENSNNLSQNSDSTTTNKEGNVEKKIVPYQFTFLDIISFYLPITKKIKTKKEVFINCINQLKFFINPLFYLKLCVLNEEKIVETIMEKKLYSVNFKDDFQSFDILRMSKKLNYI